MIHWVCPGSPSVSSVVFTVTAPGASTSVGTVLAVTVTSMVVCGGLMFG